MIDIIEQVFYALFFGSGMILGLLLLIILVLSIASKYAWGNIFVLPLTILMALEYAEVLNETGEYKHFWGMMICWFLTLFIILYSSYYVIKSKS